MLKRKSFFLYCKGKHTDFIFIQETHSCTDDKDFWRNQWGNDVWFSHGSTRSAGVAILKDNFRGKILTHTKDNAGRWIILVVTVDQSNFILVNVYASNNSINNNILFSDIEYQINIMTSKFPNTKTIWGGDFNTVLDGQTDRWPPRVDNSGTTIKNILYYRL